MPPQSAQPRSQGFCGSALAVVALLSQARLCRAQLGPQNSCEDAQLVTGSTMIATSSHAVQTEVVQIGTAGTAHEVSGHVTYQIILHLGGTAHNVYSLFGDARPLTFPAAYQEAAPFGSDLGKVSPELYSVRPTSQFDSWLAMQGPDDASTGGSQISSIGIDFVDKCSQSGQTKWAKGCSPSSSCNLAYASQLQCAENGFIWKNGWTDVHGDSSP